MQYTVTVVGLGFVGLTTALGFAEKGNRVFGVETDKQRLVLLKAGQLPFYEPGLDEALNRHLNQNLQLLSDAPYAVSQSDFIFFCVGTPGGKQGEADLSSLFDALLSALPGLDGERYRVLAVKSTIPPTTTQDRILPFLKENGFPMSHIGLANNPEFLREGHCWEDFMNADRIVCGCMEKETAMALKGLYDTFPAPFFAVTPNTGEFIKYLSNCMLATMISFANEMSKAAHAFGGVEVGQAFQILHLDARWNGCDMASYVYPGCGYGGYCLPKDTRAFLEQGREKGVEMGILREVIQTNESMVSFMADRICEQSPPESGIGILGLSFKPDSDDVRDSPAAKVIGALLKRGYRNILAYDPMAMKAFDQQYQFEHVRYFNCLEDLAEKAKLFVLVTAWKAFLTVPTEYPHIPVVDCRYALTEKK